MRNPISDKIAAIKPSGIRKFFDLVSEMKDVISLGVGEPDFDTPWHIRDEGIYSLEKGRTFYTSNSGLKELKQEILNNLSKDKRYIKPKFRNENNLTSKQCFDILYPFQYIRLFLTSYPLICFKPDHKSAPAAGQT